MRPESRQWRGGYAARFLRQQFLAVGQPTQAIAQAAFPVLPVENFALDASGPLTLNDQGAPGSFTTTQGIDPAFNPAYSQFCYELPFMPGTTQYLDTPVVPTTVAMRFSE